jgi:hypothetical protein
MRRFRGIVEPPAHAKGQGTTWQQWKNHISIFECKCGEILEFSQADYKILSQNHIEGCEGIFDSTTHTVATGRSRAIDLVPCDCPVTEARYVKICPQCRRGHWKQAK